MRAQVDRGTSMKWLIFGSIPFSFLSCTPPVVDPLFIQGVENDVLAPPPPGRGMQLRMTRTIAAGNESYACQLFQMPDEDLFVHEQTVYFSAGGHHILLYETPYTEIPARDEMGEFVLATEVHDCSDGVTTRWKVASVLGGSEIFDHPGMLRGLPDGVAVRLPPKSVIVMSVHYLNASVVEANVDARVNFSTIPKDEVRMEAGLLYLDNQLLAVPPMQHSTARMRCPIPSDVFVVNLQSHMHARGVGFSALVRSAQDAESKVVYETKKWLEPPVVTYDSYLALRTGDILETHCDFQNHETRDIGYGPRSTDEMCQLIGPYFPRDEYFETCTNSVGNFAAEWVGQGSADGAATRTCLECAAEAGGAGYAKCILESCPAIADRVSAVVRCELQQDSHACDVEKNALSQATCGK